MTPVKTRVVYDSDLDTIRLVSTDELAHGYVYEEKYLFNDVPQVGSVEWFEYCARAKQHFLDVHGSHIISSK